ncbi:lysozyme [Loktanella sp. 3ANDIMAR09]|uniref:lysozyme n=1 Tax=Loktanella sp. 3ANDIMAR09 TaxID=1225657 RepID=UPI0012ED7BC0|nr:lysozyme [Loktanella sp. 3ANDIMAR09]
MTVSDRGLLEICEHEGIVPAPYLDSVGVWTWGVGHTAAAGGPDPARMPRAMPDDVDAAIDAAIAQFRIDVAGYAARVNRAIAVSVAQHEFDALVSFDLNTGGINRALLTAAINAGQANAARHFMGWLKPPEIRKRRTAEMRLFQTGNYDANGDTITIWRTNGQGRLAGVLSTIRGGELLERFKATPEPSAADLPAMIDLSPVALELRRAQDLATQLVAAQDRAAGALDEFQTV